MTQQDFDLMIFIPAVFLGIGTPCILLLIYFAKKTNTKILQPIAKTFPGQPSFFSWYYKGDYKNRKFTISFLQGSRGSPNLWKVTLLLNSEINFDAYVYRKNPGPVLFKKRLQNLSSTEDSLYIFSGQPENAKYFMQDENNLSIVREIIELSETESAKKFMFQFRQNRNPFIFKKNKMLTNILVAGGAIKPVDLQLIQSCLDKMIMLAENLRSAPN